MWFKINPEGKEKNKISFNWVKVPVLFTLERCEHLGQSKGGMEYGDHFSPSLLMLVGGDGETWELYSYRKVKSAINSQHTAHVTCWGKSQKCGFTGMARVFNPAQWPLPLKVPFSGLPWPTLSEAVRTAVWQYMVATGVVRKHGSSL